ncbi:MAG: ABC transporter ATP-binding protein/permease [Erysipelotrichales bacterium]|nr:ABC transporter ATP-binding protein/permease [Erysipelotrichales bacterium]
MIRLENIQKTYVTGSETLQALKGISVAFRDHEFVSILGPSGGGKTTLLNIVGGLDRSSVGDLYIDGKSTQKFNERDWDTYRNHLVGFVFQNYNLIPHQTVLSNVELALTLSGIGPAERKKRAEKALEEVGLKDKLNRKPSELSGGQMQRVAIARALVNDPKIVLADEPTGALDNKTGTSIMEILKEVSKDRLVVMVTHNPDLANQYSDRIITLFDGELTSDSDPYDPKTEEVSAESALGKRHSSMSFFTALQLSLQNLWTKKGRTILTSFAGSIGIIGIALILSLSNGVNDYIKKIQEGTMSSYPLMIRSQSADMSGMVSSFIAARQESTETETEGVVEKRIVNDMFSMVGTNNLSEFKMYLDKNASEVSRFTAAIQYLYGISPNFYTQDSKGDYVSLTGRSSYSYGGMSGSSFQQIANDRGLLENQFDVLYGRWPENYDEAILVLSSAHTISDYTEYAIGLRDMSEFEKMVQAAMKGEPIESEEEPRKYTYEDFTKLTYKIIPSFELYSYNAEYNIYESRVNDAAFVKQLADAAETLKVVGVIAPKSSSQMSLLNPGIGYTDALVRHLMSRAEDAQIVKAQLADPETNVFTGKKFGDDDSEGPAFDMNSIMTIDTNAIASAIGMDMDPSALGQVISSSMTDALSYVSTDTTETESKIRDLAKTLLSGFLHDKVDEEGNAVIKMSELKDEILDYLKKDESKQALSEFTSVYGFDSSYFEPVMEQMISSAFDELDWNALDLGEFEFDPETAEIPVPETMIDPAVNGMMYLPSIQTGIRKLASSIEDAYRKAKVAEIIGTMSSKLISDIASSFHVDAEAIAGAFKMNYDEEELMRLMSSLQNSNSSGATYESNLTRLGYAEVSDPSGIDIYFRDFDSKELFRDFVDRYNRQMVEDDREDSTISYTDMAAALVSSVKQIVDTISYVLIAFIAVSLIVSSIMIGIITYISVLERIKEIGLLRAIGASKKDISHVFNAETFIIGLTAGLLGVVVTVLICIPLTAWIRSLTDIPTLLVMLPPRAGVILVTISVVLTLIAGLIPSGMAAKKDPIKALRTE